MYRKHKVQDFDSTRQGWNVIVISYLLQIREIIYENKLKTLDQLILIECVMDWCHDLCDEVYMPITLDIYQGCECEFKKRA